MTQPPMEYLDAGSAPPATSDSPAPEPAMRAGSRAWLPIMIGGIVFLITVVFLGAIAADTAARNYEMNQLITAMEESEAAMGEVQDNVTGIASAYRDRLPLDEQDQNALNMALEAAASQGREAIAAAGEDVAAVRWLAWHRDIARAQEAYLAHNRAWQDYLERASSDGAEFARPQDDVNTTFMDAEGDVRRAVPFVPLYDLADRVDVIFAPPPADESGSNQAA